MSMFTITVHPWQRALERRAGAPTRVLARVGTAVGGGPPTCGSTTASGWTRPHRRRC